MKRMTVVAAAAALILSACAGNPEGKKADTADAVEAGESVGTAYDVDTTHSSLVWKGTKVTGAHEGTVDIKSGSLLVDNEAVTGGNFVLDMNTISSTDLEGEYKNNLDGHLKNEDFFNVTAHPEATFQITEVREGASANQVIISGNLTIKGISKNITFDANVEEITETTVKVNADFNITRADWGVNYTGKEDDLISKEINFKVKLVANKA
ncbi:YceI family protein [Sphingobacterium sp. lm-10]|uniref:YceI family protein n=1 Tax=Sphingobacterium sp. lm-10 TaxID=2944904 RepID=UPI0020213A8C|nr:YceI family protein [Sphingobacterium sp. lm-10]MCL7986375.1 YceI family protein [Sphingobacterium sp. lm-10]